MTTISFGDYMVALAIGKRESPSHIALVRYAGMGFFVEADGTIATCAHITDSIGQDEVLIAQDLVTKEKGEVFEVRRHPIYDFAIGKFLRHHGPMVLSPTSESNLLGLDVEAFGCTSEGRSAEGIRITPRLFKGSVVGQGPNPSAPGSRSTLELSFPSHKGFSGTPLLTAAMPPRLAGMLFSNLESSIEQYSYSETTDGGHRMTERIHKVVELGIAHSPADIQTFLSTFPS